MKKDGDNNLIPSKLSFEDLKQVNRHGIEYWSARNLQPCLGYSQWRRFENAIQKAIESCKQSGNDPKHHFASAGNPITSGKGRTRLIEDYHLSRFACYLIAQNGDPRKPEIAHAQKNFAIQTRLQELSDAIKVHKGQLMDRTELAANQFWMTQTREKLKRENIKNQRDAIEAHEAVGKEIRAAIAKIGGTPPENISPAENIKKVEKRLRMSKPRLSIDLI